MDPNNRGPEFLNIADTGDHTAGHGHLPRPSAAQGPHEGAASQAPAGQGMRRPAPAVRFVSGDLLVTVDPVCGSAIEPCPFDDRPARPARRSDAARTARADVARPPLPHGSRPPLSPERQEERERLVHLLTRGRSIRLTGPHGSGRTTLLDLVADDCAHLAPDGVIRLSGYRRTVKDVLYDLCAARYETGTYRPDDARLRDLVSEIGAVVLLDDLEFGGAALDELLDATPECAFLFVATPDTPAPSAHTHLEDLTLRGVGQEGGMAVLRHVVGRDLTGEEAAWAADLLSAAEGLSVRFVQAGALLARRSMIGQAASDPRAAGWPLPEQAPPASAGGAAPFPLPPPAGGAGLVAPLASLLSAPARHTLRFAVALGGEVPHPTHLPTLLGDPDAGAAVTELLTAGLITPVGARHRLADGVQTALEAAGFADDAAERVRSAGEHYIVWAGRLPLALERVLSESDAVLAVLAALVQHTTAASGGRAPTADGERSLAVQLARTVAPMFAAGLDWGVWERALRSGQEAARRAGEVAEEAYFHHELGVLALCTGRLDRARAELEASIGLRGALADKPGTVAGRHALALVTARAAAAPQARPAGSAATDHSGGGVPGPFGDGGRVAGHGPASEDTRVLGRAVGHGPASEDTRVLGRVVGRGAVPEDTQALGRVVGRGPEPEDTQALGKAAARGPEPEDTQALGKAAARGPESEDTQALGRAAVDARSEPSEQEPGTPVSVPADAPQTSFRAGVPFVSAGHDPDTARLHLSHGELGRPGDPHDPDTTELHLPPDLFDAPHAPGAAGPGAAGAPTRGQSRPGEPFANPGDSPPAGPSGLPEGFEPRTTGVTPPATSPSHRWGVPPGGTPTQALQAVGEHPGPDGFPGPHRRGHQRGRQPGRKPGRQRGHQHEEEPPGRYPGSDGPSTLISPQVGPMEGAPASGRGRSTGAARNTRRNLFAAAGGALLAAVLGTVVTLGATSDHKPSDKVTPGPARSDDGAGGLQDEPTPQSSGVSSPQASQTGGSPSVSESDSPTSGESGGTPQEDDSPDSRVTPPGDPTIGSPGQQPPSHQPPPTRPPTTPPATPTPPTTPPPAPTPPTSTPSGAPADGSPSSASGTESPSAAAGDGSPSAGPVDPSAPATASDGGRTVAPGEGAARPHRR